MGRAARKGEPGSGRLILCEQDDTGRMDEEWGMGKIFNMKEERDRLEQTHISKLVQHFQHRIIKQEECFEAFKEAYEKLRKELNDDGAHNKKLNDVQVINSLCFSVLDRWALWLDGVDDGFTFDTRSTEELKLVLKNQVLERFPKSINHFGCHGWMTPVRSIVLAKHLATKAKPELSRAAQLLDELIDSKDNFLYPAAYYYRAFIYIKDDGFKNKNKFIKMLRATQTIIEQHITMHMSFYLLINQIKLDSNRNAFIVIEAYKQQKENIVQLLKHIVCSIRSVLGSRCSLQDLKNEGIHNETEAKRYYDELKKLKCILNCQVNETDSVPNRDMSIRRIAIEYGVSQEALEAFLDSIKNKSLSENQLEEEIRKTKMMPRTMTDFWNTLKDYEVLTSVQSQDLNSANFLDDRNSTYVIFNPTPDVIKKLQDKGENEISNEETKVKIKYAKINLDMLKKKKISLKKFGHLTNCDDLSAVNINETERPNVWKSLIDQKILTENGSLSPDYKEGITKFRYPDCPIYEHTVMSLIERTYVGELIRRQLLKEQDPIRRLKILAYLPLDPYKNMLDDLQSAHIISGERVTDDRIAVRRTAERVLFNVTNEIIHNDQTKDQISSFLHKHQAQYATIDYPIVSLESIERDIWTKSNICLKDAVLNAYGLVGFNHVIKLSNKKFLTITRSFVCLAIYPILIPLSLFEGVIHILTILTTSCMVSMFDVRRLKDVLEYLTDDYLLIKLRAAKLFVLEVDKICCFLEKLNQATKNTAHQTSEELEIKEIVETSAFETWAKIGETMALGRLNGQIESDNIKQLGVFFGELNDQLNTETGKISKDHLSSTKLKATLNQLYRLKGPTEADKIVMKETERIKTDWYKQTQFWLSNVLDSLTIELNKRVKKYHPGKELGNEAEEIKKDIENVLDTFKVIHRLGEVATKLVKNFQWELESFNLTAIEKNTVFNECEEEQLTSFQKKVRTHLKSQLKQVGNTSMKFLTDNISRLSTEHVTSMTTRIIKGLYQERDQPHGRWIQQLANERRKEFREWIANQRPTTGVHQHSSLHIHFCTTKLLKETNDPKLLAALIREDSLPDGDPFIQTGLFIMKDKYPHLNIELNQVVADQIENDLAIAKAIRLGWRNLNKQKCPFESFPVGELGCADEACALRGLTEHPGYAHYIKQAKIGESEADSFDNMRTQFLEREDYQNAIWLNIKTFVLPIAKRLANAEKKREYIEATKKHVYEFAGNSTTSIIKEKEANQLEKRLDLCVS